MGKNKPLNHLAVVMDGNGRWAKMQGKDRILGHAKGAKTAIDLVEACVERNIKQLTLYALSVENMTRDQKEVTFITNLLVDTLVQEKQRLHNNGVRVSLIGNRHAFDQRVCDVIREVELFTQANQQLHLRIAFNFSGRWQIQQALLHAVTESSIAGQTKAQQVYAHFKNFLQQDIDSDPDLFIRSGGERRLSNFMLWHLAYTELYFSDVLWPDFDAAALDQAIDYYHQRDRRYGQVPSEVS